ncbi:hypothetical protein FRB90_010407, partial [Tulasnella sp. 427]
MLRKKFPEALAEYNKAKEALKGFDKGPNRADRNTVSVGAEIARALKSRDYLDAERKQRSLVTLYLKSGRTRGLGNAYCVLGNLLLDTESWGDAEYSYQEALRDFKKKGNSHMVINCHLKLGVVRLRRAEGISNPVERDRHLNVAITFFGDALEMSIETGEWRLTAVSWMRLGDAYLEWNEGELALEQYTMAFTLFKALDDESKLEERLYTRVGK